MINLGDLALYAFLTLLIVERGLGHMSYVYVSDLSTDFTWKIYW